MFTDHWPPTMDHRHFITDRQPWIGSQGPEPLDLRPQMISLFSSDPDHSSDRPFEIFTYKALKTFFSPPETFSVVWKKSTFDMVFQVLRDHQAAADVHQDVRDGPSSFIWQVAMSPYVGWVTLHYNVLAKSLHTHKAAFFTTCSGDVFLDRITKTSGKQNTMLLWQTELRP